MFYNGNNQALGLMMQGYSDTIKVNNDSSKAGDKLMANMRNITNDYIDQDAKIAQTKGQNLMNEYAEKTMGNRVAMTGEQLEGMKQQNEYGRRTMDDRVALVGEQLTQAQLNNQGLSLDVDFKQQTHKKGIEARNRQLQSILNTADSKDTADNAINYADAEKARLNKELDHMDRMNFHLEPIKLINGQYFTTDKDGNYTIPKSPEEAQIIMNRNANKQINIDNQMAIRTSYNQSMVAGNQANEAQNKNTANTADVQGKLFDETKELIEIKGGYTPQRVEQMLLSQIDAIQSGQQKGFIIDDNVFSPRDPYIQSILGNSGMSHSSVLGLPTGDLNVGLKDQAIKRNAWQNLLGGEVDVNDPEQMNKLYGYIAATQSSGRDSAVAKEINQIGNFNDVILAANQHKDIGVLKTALGKITQYFPVGTDYKTAEANALANIAQFGSLIEASSKITGAASDKDMEKLAKTIYDWKKNDSYNGKILQYLAKQQVNRYNALLSRYGGEPAALLAIERSGKLYNNYAVMKMLADG